MTVAWTSAPYHLVAQIVGQGPVPIHGFQTEKEARDACRQALRHLQEDPGYYAEEVRDFAVGVTPRAAADAPRGQVMLPGFGS